MMQTGRLIIDPPMAGSRNMAVDQAILEHARDSNQSTLRFYQWKPATISLGYFQPIETRKTHQRSLQCPIVRRTTGGGAIVHDNELTYSICVPESNKWSTDNQRLYALIHNALIRSLLNWNIHAQLILETLKQENEPFLCFQRRAIGDVTINGEKVCGSAQRRINKSILQHGSILIQRSLNAPELPGIVEISGKAIILNQLSSALINEIQTEMEISFRPGQLTASEQKRVVDIQSKRFESDVWISKR